MQEKKNSKFQDDELTTTSADRCCVDGLIKGANGFLIGVLFSLIFTKRRAWPVILGTGFGLGMAFDACEGKMKEELTELSNKRR